jgi:hypothetical protein
MVGTALWFWIQTPRDSQTYGYLEPMEAGYQVYGRSTLQIIHVQDGAELAPVM